MTTLTSFSLQENKAYSFYSGYLCRSIDFCPSSVLMLIHKEYFPVDLPVRPMTSASVQGSFLQSVYSTMSGDLENSWFMLDLWKLW